MEKRARHQAPFGAICACLSTACWLVSALLLVGGARLVAATSLGACLALWLAWLLSIARSTRHAPTGGTYSAYLDSI